MKKLFFAGIVAAMLLLMGTASWADQTVIAGISEDGINWVMQVVTVPDDDYIRVDLNGSTVLLWGPNFDEADIPYAANDPECKCSVHLEMGCQCDYNCVYGVHPGQDKYGTCKTV